MDRRSFLAGLGLAAIAAPLARFLPAVEPGAVIVPSVSIPSTQAVNALPMRGLPYIVSNNGNYFGVRHTWIDNATEQLADRANSGADQAWHESLPRDRSLIPEDYHRDIVED